VKSVFFVPVFNQIQELGPLLDKLRTDVVGSTILLVNNGSDDGSEELIRNSGLPFLDLERNLGIGYSFIRAIEWALENSYDVFGSIAGNGKMLPSEMPRVLDPLLNDSADYVTGSRFLSFRW
jgi:glycosyltransferase involved in cell wall biosynthesis